MLRARRRGLLVGSVSDIIAFAIWQHNDVSAHSWKSKRVVDAHDRAVTGRCLELQMVSRV